MSKNINIDYVADTPMNGFLNVLKKRGLTEEKAFEVRKNGKSGWELLFSYIECVLKLEGTKTNGKHPISVFLESLTEEEKNHIGTTAFDGL